MSYTNSFSSKPLVHRTQQPTYRPVPRRNSPTRSKLPTVMFTVVLLVGLAGACWYATSTLSSLLAGAQAGTQTTTQTQSTPKSAWRAGEVPMLYQKDPTWSQATYADGIFAETGCGPTCLSMVYIALTGRTDHTPTDMGALSEDMGCATPDGTAWAFMTDGAATLGLVAQEVSADEASVRQALVSGSPIICSVGPGDFTTTGHFIVLTGIDEQGNLIIRDPNSPERTARTWDFDTVLGQCRALWVYTNA